MLHFDYSKKSVFNVENSIYAIKDRCEDFTNNKIHNKGLTMASSKIQAIGFPFLQTKGTINFSQLFALQKGGCSYKTKQFYCTKPCVGVKLWL